MKRLTILLFILVVLAVGSFWVAKAHSSPARKLRHVVAFKFKPQVSLAQQQKATQEFYALQKTIPQIIEFEGGEDLYFQQKKGKFTHCFIVTVKSEQDLAIYGEHPDHKAFSKGVDPLLAEVMVVDYWTE
jgi:hypothetical protein